MGEALPKNNITRRLLDASLKSADIDVNFILLLCIINSRETFITEFKKHTESYIQLLQDV
jgi:hypothetical protein